MNQIKWVFENLKGSKRKFFTGLVAHNLILMPLIVIAPIFLSKFVDTVFVGGKINFTEESYSYLMWFFITSILVAVFAFVKDYFLESAGCDILYNLRDELYRKLSTLSPSFYKKTRTGDIMMRLTGDLEAIKHFVVWVLSNTVYAIGLFAAGIIIFYSTNWLLATILLITAPFYSGILMYIRKKAAPMYKNLREANSHLNATAQENISANRVVRAFVREEFEKEKFDIVNREYCDSAIDASLIWGRMGPIVNLIGNVGLIVVLLVGGLMAVYGKITLGEFLLFYNLNWLMNDSLNVIGIVINDTQRFISSTQKVYTLYYSESEIKNPPQCIHPNVEKPGEVVFRNVCFKYENHPVLNNVNIHARPGQTIGIMGPTGSGKSTICLLMSRFFDVQSGAVKIDGVDVRDYDLTELRSKIGISMQDVFLFSNTIDSNISYGNTNMSEDKVHEYALMADASSFIKRTTDGYDTVIGEKGVGLSGGQKQRLALARALAYETPIVILDDTTSALDMETEKQIQARLAERKGKQTTFIVAQRISSVKDADRIYVLNNNTVAECGTHNELLNNKGYYYDIYCLQQGTANEKEGE